jgi:hypothetical protein
VDQDLKWQQEGNSLVIQIPKELQDEASRPGKQAYAFKVESQAWENFADSLPHEPPLTAKDNNKPTPAQTTEIFKEK